MVKGTQVNLYRLGDSNPSKAIVTSASGNLVDVLATNGPETGLPPKTNVVNVRVCETQREVREAHDDGDHACMVAKVAKRELVAAGVDVGANVTKSNRPARKPSKKG